jgi:hypothetical protein
MLSGSNIAMKPGEHKNGFPAGLRCNLFKIS